MKNIFLISFLICIFFPNSLNAQSYVFISEYIEGSGNNKSIEIYNGTGSTLDLSANSFELRIFFNGSLTSASPIALTGSVASGDVYVISNSSASVTILNQTDQTSSGLTFNGDDAVELRAGVTTLDVIGQIGFDPGTQWGTAPISTADNTIVRKSYINSGDINPSDAFDPTPDWDGFTLDTFSNLGSHSGPILPVELISFTAIAKGRGVDLAWKTATEVENHGFEVERRVARDRHLEGDGLFAWAKIGFVEGNGTVNNPKEYSFTDNTVSSGLYSYRLKQIDRDGKFEYSQEIEVKVSKHPNMFALMQNYPNPFNPTTAISFYVPATGKVMLQVFDMLGKEVATLVNGEVAMGAHSVQFNAAQLPRQNAGGQASGLYFYTLRAGNFNATRKMLLVK